MYEILPSEPLASLLRTFESWGGVVDYVLIGWDASVSLDPYELHKEAAIFTATTLVNRHKQHLTGYLLKTQQDISQLEALLTEALLTEERKGLQMRPDEAKGQQISLAEFFALGKRWVSREEMYPSLSNAEQLASSLEKYGDKLITGLYVSTRNYCHAFSDPPYTLHSREGRLTQREIDALFEAINKQLFGENLDNIVVYQWTTDWVDYLCFYEGYDWWGSYLWTVYDTKTKIFVGIAASATD